VDEGNRVVNHVTGEAILGGLEILFTGDAWVQIEARLDTTTMEVFGAIAQGRIGYTMIAAIAECAHEAWRRRHAPNQPRLKQTDAVAAIERGGGLVSAINLISKSVQLSGTIIPQEADADEAEEPDPFQVGLAS
jgi:hypothetical protein